MEASGVRRDGCTTCRSESDLLPPVRERVLVTDHWRAVHAPHSAMPGWLLLVPRAHVRSVTRLAPAALAELGPLLHVLGTALEEVTGCERTYVAAFGEAPEPEHLQVHVVPRLADHPPLWRGTDVFGALRRPDHLQLDAAAMDLVAAQLVRVLARSR